MAVLGVLRKNRKMVSYGLLAGFVFDCYLAYSFLDAVMVERTDYDEVPALAWVVLGTILVFGIVMLATSVLILTRKTVVGTKFVDWILK